MNTNYIQPQSKLTPRQSSALNKLNPFMIEKDYSVASTSNLLYKEYFTRYYHNTDGHLGILKKSNLIQKDFLCKKRKNNFHTCCPYTHKKKCFCNFFNEPEEQNLNSFINKIHNGELELDITGPNVKLIKNANYLDKKEKIEKENKLIDERIKTIKISLI
jgi:hypothetical protein